MAIHNHLRCVLFIALGLFTISSFAQPGDDRYQMRSTDTIWKGNKILVLNAAKETLEISKIKNGKKHGAQKLYYPSGNLSAVTIFKNGVKYGKYRLYLPNGKLKEAGKFKNNLNIGDKKTYDAAETLLRDENYSITTNEEGKEVSLLDGTIKYYYNNGNVSQEYNYTNGKRNGVSKEYHRNAENSLKSEVYYKNDLRHGAYAHFDYAGKPERSGVFYEQIEVNDSIYKNVYDGEIITYQSSGVKQRVEHWKNFKKNGTVETFHQETGELYSRENYVNNLKQGAEERWDKDGTPTYQAFFEIVEVDNKLISLQVGTETKWTKGVVRTTAQWQNGLKNGTVIAYFPNGEIEQITNFKDGILDGKRTTFFENGAINQDFTYQSNGNDHKYIGWNKVYSQDGNLLQKFFAKGDGDNIVEERFENGFRRELNVVGIFKLEFSPEQKLASVLWMLNSSHPLFGYDFFSIEQPRRIHFLAKDDYNLQTASLTQNGTVLQVLTNGRFVEINQENLIKTAATIKEAYNPKWFTESLATKPETQGKYQWQYADGSPFFNIEFDKGLPHGNWIVYDAVSKDTLINYQFQHGKPVGNWVKKKSGGILISSQKYNVNHQVTEAYQYSETGILIENNINDSLGRNELRVEYYPTGKLKQMQNYRNNTSLYLDAKGDTLSSNLLYTKADSIRIIKSFYSENRLRNQRINNLTSGIGEAKGYFENRQLRTFHEMRNDEPYGIYENYDETGKLLTRGNFKTGKRHGQWSSFDATEKEIIVFYEDGEIILAPQDENDCSCYDRSMPNDKIKFAPSLTSLTDFKKVLPYLPNYLLPVENFNFEKIFYTNFQASNSNFGGFSSMKLLLYRELSFYLPAAKHIKINLNPCRTEGYTSNIQAGFSYNSTEKKNVYTSLETNRIAISLEKNPLQSTLENQIFTAYFDTKTVDLKENKLEIEYATNTNACFTQGIINGFLNVEVIKAKPIIEPELKFWQPQTNDFPLLKDEISKFYGFEITEAKLHFDFPNNGKNIQINAATIEMLAGSNFVAANLEIDGKMVTDTNFAPKDANKTIDTEDLKRFLESKGFYRIRIKYSEENQKLQLQFYTEK